MKKRLNNLNDSLNCASDKRIAMYKRIEKMLGWNWSYTSWQHKACTTSEFVVVQNQDIAANAREINIISHIHFLSDPKIAPFTNDEREIRFENRCATDFAFRRKKTVLSQPWYLSVLDMQQSFF